MLRCFPRSEATYFQTRSDLADSWSQVSQNCWHKRKRMMTDYDLDVVYKQADGEEALEYTIRRIANRPQLQPDLVRGQSTPQNSSSSSLNRIANNQASFFAFSTQGSSTGSLNTHANSVGTGYAISQKRRTGGGRRRGHRVHIRHQTFTRTRIATSLISIST